MAREFARFIGMELRRRPYLIGFLVVLAGLAVWALIPFPKRTIKHVIVRATKIVEARDIERLEPLFSDKFFSTQTGDRAKTIQLLTAAFDELTALDIKIKRIRIEVSGDTAAAIVEFTIVWTMRRGELANMQVRGLRGEQSLSNPIERVRLRLARSPDGYWQFTDAELLEAGTPRISRKDMP
ncbi:MAG: nuclear transport factor 2 family protein [Candidatus Sumerlaeia bacterium]|nr:nuclear transport factor 2 family protein [Candidatus Sumerlaeia bacterium]